MVATLPPPGRLGQRTARSGAVGVQLRLEVVQAVEPALPTQPRQEADLERCVVQVAGEVEQVRFEAWSALWKAGAGPDVRHAAERPVRRVRPYGEHAQRQRLLGRKLQVGGGNADGAAAPVAGRDGPDRQVRLAQKPVRGLDLAGCEVLADARAADRRVAVEPRSEEHTS